MENCNTTTRNKSVQTDGLDDRVDEWLEWDKNIKTCEDIRILQESKSFAILKAQMLPRLEFGASGIVGQMGAGYNRINDLVTIQTSQGLMAYLETLYFEELKTRGVAIGFDNRQNSERFAKLVAVVFLNRGICVYLFPEMCPTPFLSFCINVNHCVAGIMITADQHPKSFNGYKVYWENGAQIIPPHDKNVQTHILQHLKPLGTSWDISILHKHPLLKDPFVRVSARYYMNLRRNILNPEVCNKSQVIITYTEMHGIGRRYMVEAFKAGNLKPFITLKEKEYHQTDLLQLEAPTLQAFQLAIQTADQNDSTLIIANNTVVDHVSVVEKNTYSEEWRVFSSNELGTLLAWWMFHCCKTRDPKVVPGNLCMVGSGKISNFLRKMAQVEGFYYEETLPGFRWIGNKVDELLKKDYTVLFACDDPLGFMCGSTILDKDGISAGLYIAELVAFLDSDDMSLYEKLQDLYSQYDFDSLGCQDSTFIPLDPWRAARMFKRLRNFANIPDTYPLSLSKGKYRVVNVHDLTTGYNSRQPEREMESRRASKTEMLTFEFENGQVATLRARGEEKKIEYYSYVSDSSNLDEDLFEAFIEEFIQPEQNNLKRLGLNK